MCVCVREKEREDDDMNLLHFTAASNPHTRAEISNVKNELNEMTDQIFD